jgi:hypothetical protein
MRTGTKGPAHLFAGRYENAGRADVTAAGGIPAHSGLNFGNAEVAGPIWGGALARTF